MNLKQIGANLHLTISLHDFNLYDTLNCGQCFRWQKNEDETLTGIAFERMLTLKQTNNELIFYDTTVDDFDSIWKFYFDLETDYQTIKQKIGFDKTMKKSIEYAGGIRILKQDSFEALCSFIISQNNNIPHIKNTIKKLCCQFGVHIGEDFYAFPKATTLANLSITDLKDISLGYRDAYLLDCAQKVSSGELCLAELKELELEQARQALCSIKGVGPKVAECALLFGFYRVEAFPVDTWIKKALQRFYENGFPNELSAYAGIAQQYLFHYIRTCPEALKEQH